MTPKKKVANASPRLKKGRQAAFLKAYAQLGNITQAAAEAGVDRSQHYDWLTDAKYAEAFEAAQSEAEDALHAEARRRAVDGWLEPVFWQGEIVGRVRKHSDTLLIFLMKATNPGKYREGRQFSATATGDGKGVTLVLKEGEDVP